MEKQATSSLPSSTKRSLSSAPHLEIKEVPVGIENHEEIQQGGPEFGGKATSGQKRTQRSAEEENKRQERLLRDKIAQKRRREIQKDHLIGLQNRVKYFEKKKRQLEVMLSHFHNENQMLRHSLMNLENNNKAKNLENRVKDLVNKAKDLENVEEDNELSEGLEKIQAKLEEDNELSEFENSEKELEKIQSEFEKIVSNVQNENQMLKDSLMNSTGQMGGAGGSNA